MIARGCLYVDVMIEYRGEQFVGDQEYYFDDQQDQQEFIDQEKYSMRSPCWPIHHLII
jgi:hypothetical protein